MKKILSAIIIATLTLTFGCENALEEKNYGQIANSDFWNTEADAEAAIKAAYGSTRGGWEGFTLWQFVVEDMGTDIATGGYFATYDYTAYTGWSATTPDFIEWGIWPAFWESINYSNTVLDYVPGMDINEQVKNRIIGEAHALRAMVYFYLVNWFGGMAEVTTTLVAPMEIPRQTVEQNYQLMENDLTTAIGLLPLKSELVAMGETDYGRLTKGAAQALLARVYLQQGKWQECADAAQVVMNSNEYSLEPDYKAIFAMSNEGFINKEVIWVMPFIAGTSPVIDAVVLQVYLWRAPENTDYAKYYDWNGDIRVTTDFYNSFETGDLRRKLLLSSTDPTTDPIMMLKFPADPATDGYNSGTDYPLIRLADVILMRAEALANLNNLEGAVNEINKVRNRAGLSDLNAANFTKTSLLSHIYMERKWELYFEGHAKRDMIRMDYEGMLDYIKSVSEDWETFTAERYLLLPIPANALASNPGLNQNPGF
jgi:starch-binding outer membrane protein, SusD/RagB family